MVELYIIYNVYSVFELMHTLLLRLALWFLTLVMLSACGSKDDPIINPDIPAANEQPVCFSSSLQEGEELVTRAQDAPSCTRASADFFYTRANTPLNQNFIVYGYKTLSESNQPIVFPGYNVTYTAASAGTSEDNTHNYSYVDPTNKQYIKYWDYSASEYRYWGYVAGNDNIQPDPSDDKSIVIKGLSAGITEPNNYLISELKTVQKSAYNQVVQLRFVHPYAKVRVMVYCGEKIEDEDVVNLTQITFGPNDPSVKIMKSATVQVSYPMAGTDGETYSIQYPQYFEQSFSYQDLNLKSDNCASNQAAVALPDGASSLQSFLYVLPTGTNTEATAYKFEVCINGDTSLQSAVVPASYMHWKPNYQYTYIFKITEAGKKMEFYDVMIDPWKYGGSQEEEWKNW